MFWIFLSSGVRSGSVWLFGCLVVWWTWEKSVFCLCEKELLPASFVTWKKILGSPHAFGTNRGTGGPVPYSDDTVELNARQGNLINYSRPGRLTASSDPGGRNIGREMPLHLMFAFIRPGKEARKSWFHFSHRQESKREGGWDRRGEIPKKRVGGGGEGGHGLGQTGRLRKGGLAKWQVGLVKYPLIRPTRIRNDFSVMRILITFMRIRIRILPFTLMRIRIRIRIPASK